MNIFIKLASILSIFAVASISYASEVCIGDAKTHLKISNDGHGMITVRGNDYLHWLDYDGAVGTILKRGNLISKSANGSVSYYKICGESKYIDALTSELIVQPRTSVQYSVGTYVYSNWINRILKIGGVSYDMSSKAPVSGGVYPYSTIYDFPKSGDVTIQAIFPNLKNTYFLVFSGGKIYMLPPGTAVSSNSIYSVAMGSSNSAPVARNTSLTTAEDTAGTVTLLGTDIDGDALTYSVVTAPNSAHGTVTISGDKATFTPKPNWNGTTTFTYKATDASGVASNTATVSVTVTPMNDAPVASNTSLTTAEDTTGTVTLVATDVEGDALSYSLVSAPNAAHGTVFIAGDKATFQPKAHWNGTTSFTYKATDPGGLSSNVATVTVTVTPVNDAPSAFYGSLITDEDIPGVITLNATDPDGDALTYSVVTQPTNNSGTVTISGDQATFVPARNWFGTTSFTYRATDPEGRNSNVATITVTVNAVNDPPVVSDRSLTVMEDQSGNVTLLATDPENDALTYEVATAPNALHGSVTITGSAARFTPVRNWTGTTSFTYRAIDYKGAASTPATVTVTVTPVNDAPDAENIAVSTPEDTKAVITLVATDPEGDSFTYSIQGAPNSAHGSVTLSGDKATFTPAKNWNGTTTFTYMARDSHGAGGRTGTVTVTVTPVNDAPTVGVRTLFTDEDTAGSIVLAGYDVDGDSLTFSIASLPPAEHGTASLLGNTLTFVPAPDWNGGTTFTYIATDPDGLNSNAGTIYVDVTPINDPPSARDLTLTTLEDKAGTAILLGTDIDGDALTYGLVQEPNPAHGTVSISGNKATFTPAADWNGTTSFTYKAIDPDGLMAIGTVTVMVTPVNDAPITQSSEYTLLEDEVFSGRLLSSDIDSERASSTVFVDLPDPAHGTVTNVVGNFRFTPAKDWNGTTSFTFKVSDPEGLWSNVSTVTLHVTPVNDAPIAADMTEQMPVNTERTFALSASDVDIGDTLTGTIVSSSMPGAATLVVDGASIKVTPLEHWYGSLDIEYFVTDLAGAESNRATFHLEVVLPAPDVAAPVASLAKAEECNNLDAVSQYLFQLTDYESGIDLESIKVIADFQGELFDVNYAITNQAAIDKDHALEVGARTVEFKAVIGQNSGLAERLQRAFFALEAEGGRLPFQFVVSSADLAGNSATKTFTVNPLDLGDDSRPTIQIATDVVGDVLTSVNGLTVTVDDDLSGIDAREVSATLIYDGAEYPVSFYAPIESGAVSDNACSARHPLHLAFSSEESTITEQQLFAVLAASYVAQKPVTIRVAASDYAKNVASKELEFTFEPAGLDASPVSVPGIKHQFRDKQNGPTVSIPVEDVAFELDTEIEYSAIVPGDLSGVPLAVNGVSILPGDVVPLGSFLLKQGGKITFDIRADANQVEGDGVVYLIPNGDASRMVKVPVHVWMPDVEVSSSNWEPYQLFDRLSFKASQTDPLACDITGAEQSAKYSDRINKPVCFLRWTDKPPESYALPLSRPELSGYVPLAGEYQIGYEVIIYSAAGAEFVIQQGSVPMKVKPAGADMKFEISARDKNIYRFVTDFEGTLLQKAGPSCSLLTTDEQIAENNSMTNRPACFIEWSEPLPDGLEPSQLTTQPVLNGSFTQVEGNAVVDWKVISFSGYGTRVELMSGSQELVILEPPAPGIDVSPRVQIKPNMFGVSTTGGFVGDLTVSSINAPMKINKLEDGVVIDSDSTQSGFGDTISYRSRLSIGAKPLWTLTKQAVTAAYSHKPEIASTFSYEVLSVPSDELRPKVEVDNTTVLNTQDLVVRASIHNPYDSNEVYDPVTMGQWDVRLLNYVSYNQRDPLTDYAAVDAEGNAVFSIPLTDIGTQFLRVLPEGRVISPVPEYEHQAVGLRPLYVTVLRGEAIDSEISARRLVGKAPLGLYATLNVADRLDYGALGNIKWESRRKGDESWETLQEGVGLDRLYKSFDEGEYEVRSIVTNKNSGAEFTTEIIEVHAFIQPDVKLNGPSNIFIGASGSYTIEATHNGEALTEADVVVQWSEDDGETWTEGGLSYTLQRDAEERVYLQSKVRMRSSPEDFDDANVINKKRIGFRPVRAPRAGVYGPKVIETGYSVEWRGLARAPYPEMDVVVKGRFILPDGSVVNSDSATYTATDLDTEAGRVPLVYEVWMEGFEDIGGSTSTTRQISVWKYQWPDWEFYVRASTYQAPSDISMRLRNPAGSTRYLEGLSYEWEIPAGLTVLSADKEDTRVFRAEKAGEYPVLVTISDGRGYESQMLHVIDVIPADPWLVDYRISTSGEEYRSPMSLRTIPEIRGGHPRDRISTHRYYLDGELVADGTRYFSTELLEGTHELGLEIMSSFGEVVRENKIIEVLPNTPPTCQLEARKTLSGWRFSADCQDVDGTIASHEWTVNGEPVGISSGRISVTVRDESVPRVTLKAFDNGRAESNTVIW